MSGKQEKRKRRAAGVDLKAERSQANARREQFDRDLREAMRPPEIRSALRTAVLLAAALAP